ncbi:MAG: RNHCP domain-containing protein, partial [Clostridia bacterium]|nr:RNHCP domain-containing protein [Clostridia bacterium]
ILDPIHTEPDPKKGFVVIHRCRKCGALRRNKAANDDDRDLLIRLTAGRER